MKKSVIEIKNFSKSFGTKKVIEDLSFEVFEGEIFAFLGANGSGKTTTIRCLLNLYAADSGELTINGDRYSPAMASVLGYLPEERGLYLNSKVLETLVYFGELKGLTKKTATENALEYLELVELKDKAKSEIKRLSSGQQQKIQLGITVINKPKILILDEPTKGLDPINRGLLLDILFKLNKDGSTIVFSTHQMEEVEKIADRLLMIKDGSKKLYGDVNEVKKGFSKGEFYIKYSGNLAIESKVYIAEIKKDSAVLTLKDGFNKNQLISELVNNIDILEFKEYIPSLNDIFIEVSK